MTKRFLLIVFACIITNMQAMPKKSVSIVPHILTRKENKSLFSMWIKSATQEEINIAHNGITALTAAVANRHTYAIKQLLKKNASVIGHMLTVEMKKHTFTKKIIAPFIKQRVHRDKAALCGICRNPFYEMKRKNLWVLMNCCRNVLCESCFKTVKKASHLCPYCRSTDYK